MGWWHNVEVGGWALLALALQSYNTLAVHLLVGSGQRGSGCIGASVPVPHYPPPPYSPSGCCECAAYPAPKGAHGMVGWLWSLECEGEECGWFSGVREVD
jgi:hypothetical protein